MGIKKVIVAALEIHWPHAPHMEEEEAYKNRIMQWKNGFDHQSQSCAPLESSEVVDSCNTHVCNFLFFCFIYENTTLPLWKKNCYKKKFMKWQISPYNQAFGILIPMIRESLPCNKKYKIPKKRLYNS
jgi:hypothetical protein